MKNIKLVEARKFAGLTQKELAERAGIAEASYQRIEYGQKPSLKTAIRIADVLGILDVRELWSCNSTGL